MRQAVLAHMVGFRSWSLVAALAFLLSACEQAQIAAAEAACAPFEQSACELGLSCDAVATEDTGCFSEHVLRGRVFDADDLSVIAGASVVARDSTGRAVSRAVVTDSRGVYVLRVIVPRSEDKRSRAARYTLSASAAGYRAVPSPVALPEVAGVADIALLPVPGIAPSPWLGPGAREPQHETLAAAQRKAAPGG